jgi:predicted AAA+ superfamily ATPase
MFELYNKRVETGIDDYENFDINEILQKEATPENIKAADRFNVLLLFNTNKFKDFRLKSKEYFKKYGIFDMMSVFYICSFLPLSMIDIIRRIR